MPVPVQTQRAGHFGNDPARVSALPEINPVGMPCVRCTSELQRNKILDALVLYRRMKRLHVLQAHGPVLIHLSVVRVRPRMASAPHSGPKEQADRSDAPAHVDNRVRSVLGSVCAAGRMKPHEKPCCPQGQHKRHRSTPKANVWMTPRIF